MSLEVGLRAEGTEDVVQLGVIVPGEIGSFSDYSNNSRELISAMCLPNDRGGLVYRFNHEDFPETPRIRVVPLDMYTDDKLMAEVGWGGSFEMPITTETRRRGRLILVHTVLH